MNLSRRHFIRNMACAVGASLTASNVWARTNRSSRSKMNILMIGIEDWTANAVGCYGNTIVKTPNVDKLAAKGIRFSRAYCMAPACNPSRTALMTSLRPDTTGVYNNNQVMQKYAPPDAPFIAGMLKQKGAWTAKVGKLIHRDFEGKVFMDQFDQIELPENRDLNNQPVQYRAITRGVRPQFTRPNRTKDWVYTDDPEVEATLHRYKKERDELVASGVESTWKIQEPFQQTYAQTLGDSGNYPEYDYDGQIASVASQMLEGFAQSGKQFFLFVGLHAPHTPLRAPKEFVEMYNPDDMPMPQGRVEDEKGVPDAAKQGEYSADIFNSFTKTPQTPENVRKAIACYYACSSYVDWAVGKLLDALEATGLADSTIVLLFSDHGFSLGEHRCWSKYTLFEQATRVPMICYVPGAKGNGKTSDGIVEYVDVLPTFCDLWDIDPSPKFEGTSFAPLLDKPDKEWKRAAFAQIRQGRSVRTRRYKYAEYRKNNETPSAFDEIPFARELYDLEKDPWEMVNLADAIIGND